LDLNFGDFYLLDVIVNMLFKSFAFRSLNMHLYRSNNNLKLMFHIRCLYPIQRICNIVREYVEQLKLNRKVLYRFMIFAIIHENLINKDL